MLDVTGLRLYYLSCIYNYMPDTSAVIGFDGEWDDEDFSFYPQKEIPVTYTITATAGTGGSISPSGSVTVPEGESQTFTITPDKDYEIASVTVDGSSVGSASTFTFENVTSPHTIAAAFTSTTKPVSPDTTGKTSPQGSGKAAEDISVVDIFNPKTPLDTDTEPDFPFTDVLESQWYYDDVYFMWEQSLMNGTSDTAFGPSGSLTRGMVVTVLYRIGGEPDVSDVDMPFTDVAAVWYYDAIKWAADEGIALGFDDGTFRPGDNVTREQMAAFISRYATCTETEIPASVEYSSFADQADISGWAIDAVKELFRADIIKGKEDNRFDPKGFASRAEFAAVLHRFIMAVGFDDDDVSHPEVDTIT